ncbi:MAG: helix-turn-helix domain-containing protein [Phaeovulum sp.]|jgi:MerR family mercuric resistance operon transcriptional regulator|uniref:MerR family transcriptional regulator n=1 Tax=Phaeovulum sp. TaxID=2934796 RepID=UPI0027317325|nr:helix-turn-helix domain-containing protein [Phaeovulum sp.]MDP2062394.1 helix-turn-helix domain-containing protein [Phaeovulum sp.]
MPSPHEAVTFFDKALRRADLARATGCNLETIRYYEGVGLLPPPARTAAGHRSYGTADVQRLRFILRARELGFTLEDVRGLQGLGDGALLSCAEVRDKAEAHLAEVRAKIADLQRIEQVLFDTVGRCSGQDVPRCAVLEALSA